MNQHQEEIDLQKIFSALKGKKTIILSVTLIGFLSSIFVSLILPKVWTSSSIHIINNDNNAGLDSSLGGSLQGISSLSSLALGSGSHEADIAIARIRSKIFFQKLIESDKIAIDLFAIKGFDEATSTPVFNKNFYNIDKEQWTAKPTFLELYKHYNDSLSAFLDRKTNLMHLSFSHRSPVFARDFLQKIIDEFNEEMRLKSLNEANASIDFLTNKLNEIKQSDVKKSMSNVIEFQLKKQVLAMIDENYFLETIDMPFVPEERTSPRRSLIVMATTLLSFIFILMLLILRFYVFDHSSPRR